MGWRGRRRDRRGAAGHPRQDVAILGEERADVCMGEFGGVHLGCVRIVDSGAAGADAVSVLLSARGIARVERRDEGGRLDADA